ncbi:molybdopterin molybdotransferase MoeA [Pedobacter sp. SD-b]|uniref:Molybdopterin molybdenumtransferase n=1 Tax=Pedobacter segetis TaxID=2793069 RepID=A0ABS1BNJ4_9SPHI|nr:molybdopterin molybdotransferase MoeA [Pedobacter segetis]MBK0384464.1 molybdopterin molybdotransferase MoeA [Pedobacter segetis]
MISYQKALNIVLSKSKSFGLEEIDLEDALGRVLAEDIVAPRDFPPFNRSAMDGIALRFEDLETGIREFKCLETVFAGAENKFEIQTGECYKIMTGAAVPKNADVVIRIEDVATDLDMMSLLKHDFKIYQNIALMGQDLKKNTVAIQKRSFINPATVGMLASLGKSRILVERLPSVNIITTGDEIIGLHQKPFPFQIFNSNAYTLRALLMEDLIKPEKYTHIKDDRTSLKSAIEKHLNTDILILTGGVSAGDADYIPEIMTDLGVEKLFHKVSIKPGKPIWCGIKGSTLIFALPGNPFSAMVTFKLFVDSFIKKSLGIKPSEFLKLPINFDRSKTSSLDEFFPVINNGVCLDKVAMNGSGDIRLGNSANALAVQEAQTLKLEKGNLVSFLLW